MLVIIGRAVKMEIIPDYVLVDSWLFCFNLLDKLNRLKKRSIKLVSMVKINNQIFTIYRTDKELSGKDIVKTHEINAQKCKKLKANIFG